jgi:hypothetical protein
MMGARRGMTSSFIALGVLLLARPAAAERAEERPNRSASTDGD